MPTKKRLPDLTKAEFDVLRVLWKSGRLSVREVHDQVTENNSWAYTTTKTVMDRMVKKEFLKRESFHRVFLYSSLISRPMGFARFISFFSDNILEMDYSAVMSLFGRSKALTPEEIKELSSILKQDKNKET